MNASSRWTWSLVFVLGCGNPESASEPSEGPRPGATPPAIAAPTGPTAPTEPPEPPQAPKPAPAQTAPEAAEAPGEAAYADVPQEPMQPLPAPEDGPEALQRLFSTPGVTKIDIRLSKGARKSLAEKPKKYTRGSVRIGGRLYDPVGVRLKGRATLKKLDDKAPFKIRFDKYDPKLNFHGLTRLTLNSMSTDRSKLKEHLSYFAYRKLGLPASRTGFAEVSVNGKSKGLYLNLESVDRRFLTRHFGEPLGELYESEMQSDVNTTFPPFDRKFDVDVDDKALSRLRDLVNLGGHAWRRKGGMDAEALLRWLALELTLGNSDGYAKVRNNYFLYHHPMRDRFYLIPWSLDFGIAPFNPALKGVLATNCIDNDACVVDLAMHAIAVHRELPTELLEQEAETTAELLRPLIERDPFVKDEAHKALTYQQNVKRNLVSTRKLFMRFLQDELHRRIKAGKPMHNIARVRHAKCGKPQGERCKDYQALRELLDRAKTEPTDRRLDGMLENARQAAERRRVKREEAKRKAEAARKKAMRRSP